MRLAPRHEGAGSSSRRPSGMNPVSTQSSMVENRPAMPASRAMMSGKLLQARPTPQGLGVVHDGLEPQYALAFGIALERQQPEADLEQRQVIPRSLDHDCLCGEGQLRPFCEDGSSARTGCGASACPGENGSGPPRVEHPVHLRPRGKEQVAGTRPGRPSSHRRTRFVVARLGRARNTDRHCRSSGRRPR